MDITYSAQLPPTTTSSLSIMNTTPTTTPFSLIDMPRSSPTPPLHQVSTSSPFRKTDVKNRKLKRSLYPFHLKPLLFFRIGWYTRRHEQNGRSDVVVYERLRRIGCTTTTTNCERCFRSDDRNDDERFATENSTTSSTRYHVGDHSRLSAIDLSFENEHFFQLRIYHFATIQHQHR